MAPAGSISRSERLDLRFDPNAKQTNLANLAVPVKVGGTLASPSVVPDPGKIAENVVGTVVGAPQGIFDTLVQPDRSEGGRCGGEPLRGRDLRQGSAGQGLCRDGSNDRGERGNLGTAAPSSSSGGVIQDTVKGLGSTLNNLFGGGGGGGTQPSQQSD